MRLGLFGLAFAALLALAASAARAEEPSGLTPAAQPRIMLGECELTLDPNVAAVRASLGPMLCLKGAAGSEIVFVSGTPGENVWLRHGQIYGGFYLLPWLSLHARARARDVLPLGEKAGEERMMDTDYALLQLGNPVINRQRLFLGLVRLPFGIDQSEVSEHYRSYENRRMWDSPPHGMYASFDDMRGIQLDLGFATNELTSREPGRRHGEATEPVDHVGEPDPEGADPKVPANRAGSARLMADFAALDGSRLVFSTYGETEGVRRFGAGFVTVSRREDMTQFEFVRRLASPGSKEMPFEQLLRVGYLGSWRGDTRWIVQFDDERYRFRRGMIEHDAKLWGHVVLRFTVSYHKSETGDGLQRWYVTSGMEARL